MQPTTVTLAKLAEFIATPVSGQQFFVADCARSDRILPLLKSQEMSAFATIYGASDAQLFGEAGPVLVELTGNVRLATALLDNGWGDAWGIYMASRVGFKSLRQHLSRLTVAELPDQRLAMFRFYDPRVIGAYLASCNKSERTHFFGPIDWIMYEVEGAAQWETPQQPTNTIRIVHDSHKA